MSDAPMSSQSSPFKANKSPFAVMQSPGMRDVGLLVLRLGLGGAMLTHGIPKIQNFAVLTDGVFDKDAGNMEFMSIMGLPVNVSLMLAILTEVGAAFALMVGLLSRLSAFGLAFTMAVAAYVHLMVLKDPFSGAEMAVIYGVGFLALMLTGPGRISIDTKLAGRKAMGK